MDRKYILESLNTIHGIRSLFNTGYGIEKENNKYDAYRLKYCLDTKIVEFEIEEFNKVEIPEKTDFYRRAVYEWAGCGGSKEHQILKWHAWNWCKENLMESAIFEKQKMDVSAPLNKLWIECGSTHVGFSFGYFRKLLRVHHDIDGKLLYETDNFWNKFCLFPFQENSTYMIKFFLSGEGILAIDGFLKWKAQMLVWRFNKKHGINHPIPEIPSEPYSLGYPHIAGYHF